MIGNHVKDDDVAWGLAVKDKDNAPTLQAGRTFNLDHEFPEGSGYREAQDLGLPHAMFVDGDEMKKRVRATLLKPDYNVHDFYHTTGHFQALARSPIFENTTLFVISVNALWISIDTDLNDAVSLMDAHPVFQVAEHAFCVYFSFEWFVRFMAFKIKRNGLKDMWFCFDSCLVFMMVTETWALTLFLWVTGSGGGSFGGASILRLFRLLRLSRMARMLRSMPELMILIKGMIAAFRSVAFTLLLLVMLIYIFSIAFRQLTEGYPCGDKYFFSILNSMWVLLINGTFLDNLGGVADDILDSSVVLAVVFLVFVALSALMVMNMLIGVLCEVVSAVAACEKEEMTVQYVKSKMEDIVKQIDEDYDCLISRKEFEKILEHKEAVRTLHEVDVDPIGLVDFADVIFPTGAEELTLSNFMELVLELRGSNTATVKNVMDLKRTVMDELKSLENRISSALGFSTKSKSPTNMKKVGSMTNGQQPGQSQKSSQQQLQQQQQQQQQLPHSALKALPAVPPPVGPVLSNESGADDFDLTGLDELSTKLVSSKDLVCEDIMDMNGGGGGARPKVPYPELSRTTKVDVLMQAIVSELRVLHQSVPGCAENVDPGVVEWAKRMDRMVSSGLTDLRQLQLLE